MLFESHKRVIPDKGITVLSLFDGISCGMVALERTGISVKKYYASEIEPNAIKISQKNYPNIIQIGDIEEITKEKIKDMGKIDLIIGGSPCQGLSSSNVWLKDGEYGVNGTGKSRLFWQYVRVLNLVKGFNPDVKFLLENVGSASKKDKEIINQTLGCEGISFNSQLLSAQNRNRVYWTNISFSKEYPHSDKVIKDIEYSCKHDIKSFEKYKDTIRFNRDNTIVSWDTSGKGNYSQQNRARCNTIKMNTLPSSGNDKNNIYLGEYSFRKIHPIEAERLQTLPDGFTECVKSASKRVELCGNGWTVDVIAWILKNLKSM